MATEAPNPYPVYILAPLQFLSTLSCLSTPCLQGVSKLSNSSPPSQTLLLCGFRPPLFFWYSLSGALCDFIQLSIDFAFFYVFKLPAWATWFLGYYLSIYFRHLSHRYLVFGHFNGSYYSSLGRMYLGYTGIVGLSTAFNGSMIYYGVNRWKAWFITTVWTGVVNYFIVRGVWGLSISHIGLTQSERDGEEKVDSEEEEKEHGARPASLHAKAGGIFEWIKGRTKSGLKSHGSSESFGLLSGNRDVESGSSGEGEEGRRRDVKHRRDDSGSTASAQVE